MSTTSKVLRIEAVRAGRAAAENGMKPGDVAVSAVVAVFLEMAAMAGTWSASDLMFVATELVDSMERS